MLIPNHPDDERLSALAAHDDDAAADTSLVSHVTTCPRCTETVAELGALRASLAELPDLAPHRPLRLLPPVADAPGSTGAMGWVRRLFAPAMTAGAAIAMVGLVGTAGPMFQGMASSGADSALEAGTGEQDSASPLAEVLRSSEGAQQPETDGGAPAAAQGSPEASPDDHAGQPLEESAAPGPADSDGTNRGSLPAERSPWPMVLFTGVVLMVGVALLRWILVPRAG